VGRRTPHYRGSGEVQVSHNARRSIVLQVSPYAGSVPRIMTVDLDSWETEVMASHRALGLLVTFDDDDDLLGYATGQRDRGGIVWCRAGDAQTSGESAPVVIIGPAPERVGRAVIHPGPMESEFWGTVHPDEELALYREDEHIGRATVAWVEDTNRGLQPNELRMIVHWAQAGGPSPFRI
jgi:hypothetical protein